MFNVQPLAVFVCGEEGENPIATIISPILSDLGPYLTYGAFFSIN
jgi:hypothetical protein